MKWKIEKKGKISRLTLIQGDSSGKGGRQRWKLTRDGGEGKSWKFSGREKEGTLKEGEGTQELRVARVRGKCG